MKKKITLCSLFIICTIMFSCSCINHLSQNHSNVNLNTGLKSVLSDSTRHILFESDSVMLYSICMGENDITNCTSVGLDFMGQYRGVVSHQQTVRLYQLLTDSTINTQPNFIPALPFRPIVALRFVKDYSQTIDLLYSLNAGIIELFSVDTIISEAYVSNEKEWMMLFRDLLPNDEILSAYFDLKYSQPVLPDSVSNTKTTDSTTTKSL